MPSRDSLSDYDRLRKRYDDLCQLRQTEPERESAKAREVLERQHAASEALVASLRAELAQAKAGGGGTTATAPSAADAAANAALTEENAELRRKLAALESRVGFHEMMSGMSVRLADEVATCTVTAVAPPADDEAEGDAASGLRRAAFELHLNPAKTRPACDEPYEESDLEYVPLEASAELELPPYLRETITFERSQAPAFLQKLLSRVAADE